MSNTPVSSTISAENIKWRWNEPYASEASNIQAGVNTPGCYRGCFLKQNSTPSISFLISKGAESGNLLLHRRTADGKGLSTAVIVPEQTITLDGWSFTTDTIIYVYVTVTYANGVATTGALVATAVDPSGVSGLEDVIRLGEIHVDAGSLEILDSMIKVDGAKRTRPAQKRGMIVESTEIVPFVSSPNRTVFQTTKKVYWGRSGVVGADPWIWLFNGATGRPITGADGGQIKVYGLYRSQSDAFNGVNQYSAADVDEDGCIQSPWIKMNFAETTWAYYNLEFMLKCYAWYELDAIPAHEEKVKVHPHANDISVKAIASTPDSLSTGTLDSVLGAVLGLINGRVRTYNTTASASATYNLLWRSNNKTSDGTVDANTISVYWNNSTLAIVAGGYISGTNVKTNGASNVTLNIVGAGTLAAGKVTTGASTLAIWSEGNWGYWKYSTSLLDRNYGADAYGNKEEHRFAGVATAIMNGIASDGNLPRFIPLLALDNALMRVSVWVSQAGIFLGHNVTWDNDNQLWKPVNSSATSAGMIGCGGGGIRMYHKLNSSNNFSTGWTHTYENDDIGWTCMFDTFNSTGMSFNSIAAYGKVRETHHLVLTMDKQLAVLQSSYRGFIHCPFFQYRANTSYDVSVAFEGTDSTMGGTGCDFLVTNKYQDGCFISVNPNLKSAQIITSIVNNTDEHEQTCKLYVANANTLGIFKGDYVYVDGKDVPVLVVDDPDDHPTYLTVWPWFRGDSTEDRIMRYIQQPKADALSCVKMLVTVTGVS